MVHEVVQLADRTVRPFPAVPSLITEEVDLARKSFTVAPKHCTLPRGEQGRRKQFNSGQAISQKGGSGGPPPKNFGKMLLAGAFWYYLKGI